VPGQRATISYTLAYQPEAPKRLIGDAVPPAALGPRMQRWLEA
jgi:hypothetical protein